MTQLYLPEQERVSQALLIDSNLYPFDSSGDMLQLCVPRMLMPNIVGLLLILTRLDVYDYGINYDERDARIQFIYETIANIGECEVLDCNAVIECLTSSTEYGIVARYTLDQHKIQWQAQNDSLYAGYNGTPQSIESNVNSTVSEDTQDSVNRLCQAVEYWMIEYREKKKTELTYALYGTMALSGIALAITAATFGAFTLIGGIVISATVTAGVSLTTALSAIENDTYFNDVKCALVQAAHEGTLTWANFDSWLIAGKVNLFGELLENDCSGDFGSFASFVQWLSYMQNAVNPVFETDCTCVDINPPLVLTAYLDLINVPIGNYTNATITPIWGNQTIGEGWYGLQNPDGSGPAQWGYKFEILFDTAVSLNWIELEFNGIWNSSQRRLWLYNGATLVRYISGSSTVSIPGSYLWNESGNWAAANKIILHTKLLSASTARQVGVRFGY